MIIVKAEKSNLDEVTDLALKLWPDNSWELLRAEFEELLESEKDKVYLAIVEGTYVGFIHMSLRNDYVEGIYIDQNFRNKGISNKLVEVGEQWSKSLGCQIASDTELDNYGSQEFHMKIGFREASSIVAFIKDLN